MNWDYVRDSSESLQDLPLYREGQGDDEVPWKGAPTLAARQTLAAFQQWP
jgi:hypothetical protein